MAHRPTTKPDDAAPDEDIDFEAVPERHAVPDGSVQAGNAASTNPGGGEMGIAPLDDSNRNTNLDRARRESRRRK